MFDDHSAFFYLLMKRTKQSSSTDLLLAGLHLPCYIVHFSADGPRRRAITIRKFIETRRRYVYPLESISSSWVIENGSAVFEEGSRGKNSVFVWVKRKKKKSRRIGWQQQFVVDMGTSPPPWSVGKRTWTDPAVGSLPMHSTRKRDRGLSISLVYVSKLVNGEYYTTETFLLPELYLPPRCV